MMPRELLAQMAEMGFFGIARRQNMVAAKWAPLSTALLLKNSRVAG